MMTSLAGSLAKLVHSSVWKRDNGQNTRSKIKPKKLPYARGRCPSREPHPSVDQSIKLPSDLALYSYGTGVHVGKGTHILGLPIGPAPNDFFISGIRRGKQSGQRSRSSLRRGRPDHSR